MIPGAASSLPQSRMAAITRIGKEAVSSSFEATQEINSELFSKPIFKLLKGFKLQQYALVSYARLNRVENDVDGLLG